MVPNESQETESAEKTKETDPNDLKKEIMEVIGSEKEGVDYNKLMEKIKSSEEQIEKVVNELLEEGICYEPTPGKIKKI